MPLRQCTFLGFQIGARGRAVWTAKAHARFKQRVREITRRNRGHRVQDVIDELRRHVTGWLDCSGVIQASDLTQVPQPFSHTSSPGIPCLRLFGRRARGVTRRRAEFGLWGAESEQTVTFR